MSANAPRLARKDQRELAGLLAREGWQLERCSRHLVFRHDPTGARLVVSGTPRTSARVQVLASARRALRDWERGA